MNDDLIQGTESGSDLKQPVIKDREVLVDSAATEKRNPKEVMEVKNKGVVREQITVDETIKVNKEPVSAEKKN